jgi:hypothetical protein
MTFSGRFRRQSAICNASQTSCAVIRAQIRDITCPLLVRAAGGKVLFQQILRYRQTMCTVTHRTKLPASFRPQPLTTQAGGNGFDIVLRQFVSKTGSAIPLFCLSECLTDNGIADESGLLAQTYLVASEAADIPATAGNPKHTTHRFNAEFCLMIFDEDILHFKRFAK